MPDVHMNAHTLVPLSQVVKQVIAEHAPTALKRDIALSLNDQLPEDAVIFGHDIALQTLMNNLLDNAIRYSPDQTEIHVTLMADHDEYILEVVDQGPGIPQALRERVFERFYRVIGTQQTGTGLGLNIVHQIVALHKGKITLDSVDGGTGLKVRVTLPDHRTFTRTLINRR